MKEYTIIIYQAEEGGYWAKVPALPGCYSQGETIDETMNNTREAIESHIAALKEGGQDIPVEHGQVISSRIAVSVGK
ncbi:MAG: type II toxin-antitoxin system HicB family antitoxin [Dehalococcoidales bacterium]|nr:type II toxin-antitoxin system HicB family antitoxin [Dehalococcoidales bacterium]